MRKRKNRHHGAIRPGTSAVVLATLIGASPADASTVTVVVEDLKVTTGELRCALFRSANGFPKDLAQAAQRVVGLGARNFCDRIKA